ncbi:MAG: PAS domain S-box protein [Desulfobaccales bacterium]
MIAVFCLLAALLSGVGYHLYQVQERQLLRDEIESLQTVASLKVDQIRRWRQERLADTRVLTATPFLAEHLRHLGDGRQDCPYRPKLKEWLQEITDQYQYLNVLLLNQRGQVVLEAQEEGQKIGPGADVLIAEALTRPRLLFSDFYRGPGPKTIRLSLLAPIMEQQGGREVLVGFLLLRLNPHQFFFPLIQSWPTASPSGETLLVRREGQEVVYLNDLRHRRDADLSLRFPLSRVELPAVQAVLGRQGLIRGRDYRGVPVLAVGRKVPESSWFLVAKKDEEETFRELRSYALNAGAVVLGLVLITALVLIVLWRRQHAYHLRDLARREVEQKKKLDVILSAAPDQIFQLDREGRLLYANQAAWAALGLGSEDLDGLRQENLPESLRGLLASWAGAGFASGRPIRGEVSLPLNQEPRFFDYTLTPLPDEAGAVTSVVVTMRDVTERRQTEDKLSCLKHLYAALSRAGDVMVRERRPQKLFEEFCRIAVEEGGLRFAWIGMAAPDGQGIEPAASWGHEEGYLQTLDLSLANPSDGRCPTGAAIRRGKTSLYHDLQNYSPPDRWQREAVARGYRSLAVLPLRVKGRIVGAMNYYSVLPHYFTPDKVELLDRLTAHLALALEMAAKEEERQEAENDLRSTSEFLNSILQHAPAPIYVVHRDGRYLLVNPAWEAITGNSREAALGRRAADFYSPATAVEVNVTHQRVLESGKPIEIEQPLIFQGKQYYFQTIKFPLHNAQGEIEAVGGICFDITESRQANEALQRSEQRYRSIFEKTPLGMFQSTFEGRYLDLNPAMAEILGYSSPQEAVAKVQDIAYEVYLNPGQRTEILRRLQAGEEVVQVEIPFRRLNGEVRTANTYFRVVREPGRSEYLEGFVEDITERKRAEDNLLEEKQFSDMVIETLPGLFYLFDDQGRLKRWNKNLEQVSGYSAGELLGMQLTDFFLEPDKSVIRRRVEEAIREGEVAVEAELITKDGRRVPYFFTGRRALIAGRPSILGTGIDLSERRRSEKALARHSHWLQTLLDLHLMADAPQEELLDFVLEACLTTMESEFGFLGLMNQAETVMAVHRWSKEAMQQCALQEEPCFFPIAEAGVWAEAVRRRQAVVLNDYPAPHPVKRGLPAGHVPLHRLLCVPVLAKGRVVAVAAVANKESDYTEEDVNAFTSLLNKLWEILRRREMEAALRESEAEYRLLVKTIPAVVTRGYADWSVDVFDEKIEALTGYPLEAFNRREITWRDLILPEDLPGMQQKFRAALKSGEPYVREYRLRTRQGEIRWIQERTQILRREDGGIKCASGVLFDISERIAAEETLKRSLGEKEVLLKEIHHRVKNNMQVISSLLRLQAEQAGAPEVQRVFQESQNRIRSMAIVHEMLYQSPNLGSISLREYLTNLVTGLFRSFRVDRHRIALGLEIPEVAVGIDLALSCGLIVNELVSNSLKHAFPDNRSGEVSLTGTQLAPGEMELRVRDTGVGLPANLDLQQTSSLGLHLVTLLAGQIHGSVTQEAPPGTTFVIRFPLQENHGTKKDPDS